MSFFMNLDSTSLLVVWLFSSSSQNQMQIQRRQEVRLVKDNDFCQTVVEGQGITGVLYIAMRVAEALDLGF